MNTTEAYHQIQRGRLAIQDAIQVAFTEVTAGDKGEILTFAWDEGEPLAVNGLPGASALEVGSHAKASRASFSREEMEAAGRTGLGAETDAVVARVVAALVS